MFFWVANMPQDIYCSMHLTVTEVALLLQTIMINLHTLLIQTQMSYTILVSGIVTYYLVFIILNVNISLFANKVFYNFNIASFSCHVQCS